MRAGGVKEHHLLHHPAPAHDGLVQVGGPGRIRRVFEQAVEAEIRPFPLQARRGEQPGGWVGL
jgi:hypothetical protein